MSMHGALCATAEHLYEAYKYQLLLIDPRDKIVL